MLVCYIPMMSTFVPYPATNIYLLNEAVQYMEQHFGGSGAGDENGGVYWCPTQFGVFRDQPTICSGDRL